MMDCKPLINPNQNGQLTFNNGSNQNTNSTIGLANSSNANAVVTYNGKLPLCMGCGKPILDRFLLKTMNTFWHEDCLKCKICDCRLGEVGSSLYQKSEMLLCRRDYLRLFGLNGVCAICKKSIPGFELVMKAKGNNYHVECFACQFCNHRFCVGDRFYLHDDKILCEYDYSERINNGAHNNPSNHLSNNSNTSATNCSNNVVLNNANNLRSNIPNHISSTQ